MRSLKLVLALVALFSAGVALAQVPTACTGITFTRNLFVGVRGDDVRCLQALLNQDPETQVAASGPGSPGNETTYFGTLTRAAVVRFQEKYASEILSPAGWVRGTGYVGPLTRAKLNSLLAGEVPTPPTPPAPTPTPTPTPAPTTGVEGTLNAKDEPLPTGVEIYAGEQNKAVMAFKLEAKDSDIRIDRIDLHFNTRPHRCLTYVSLYDGEHPIKGLTLSSGVVTEISSSEYRVRLIGLDFTVPKDSSKTITVKVSAVPVYPTGCGTIRVWVPQNGVRGIDGAGLQQLAPTSGPLNGKQFTAAGTLQGVLRSGVAADTPEGVAIISSTGQTEVELAKFTVKAEQTDVTLKEVYIDIDEGGNNNVTLTKLLAVNLYDGTTLVGTVTPTQEGYANFTDLRVAISKDTTKTLVVKGNFDSSAKNTYYTAKLRSGYGVKGEDVNENSVSDTNERTAKKVYLYTVAPLISDVTVTSQASDQNGSGGKETISGTITFKVTAKGGDIWISKDVADLDVEAQPSSGAAQSANAVLTTSATAGNWGYHVPENQSITFTVNAVYSISSGSGFWRLAVTKFKWNSSDSSNDAIEWTEEWAIGKLRTNYEYLTY